MGYNMVGWRSCELLVDVNLGGAAWKYPLDIYHLIILNLKYHKNRTSKVKVFVVCFDFFGQ
jgi:hypothetical protein